MRFSTPRKLTWGLAKCLSFRGGAGDCWWLSGDKTITDWDVSYSYRIHTSNILKCIGWKYSQWITTIHIHYEMIVLHHETLPRKTPLFGSSTTPMNRCPFGHPMEFWDPKVTKLPVSTCSEQPKKRFHAKPNGNQKICKTCLQFSSSWQFRSWWRKSKTFELNPSIDIWLGKMFSLYLRPKKFPIPSM